MKSNIADYYLLRPQGATEEVVQQNEANLKAKILKQNTEISVGQKFLNCLRCCLQSPK